MILQELFDRSLPVKWDETDKDVGDVLATFMIDDKKYDVVFGQERFDFPDYERVWEVAFYLSGKNDKGEETYYKNIEKPDWGDNKRGEIAVLSTVISVIKTFAQKHDPQILIFTAKEPSRIKLYNRMIRTLAGKDWEVQTQPYEKGGIRYMLVSKSQQQEFDS